MPYEEAAKVLVDGVPSYMPEGKDFRVVKLSDEDHGCPCGGTHVKHMKDIVEIEVTKINKKGKNTRVSYTVKGWKGDSFNHNLVSSIQGF